jgi:hypothetical protein
MNHDWRGFEPIIVGNASPLPMQSGLLLSKSSDFSRRKIHSKQDRNVSQTDLILALCVGKKKSLAAMYLGHANHRFGFDFGSNTVFGPTVQPEGVPWISKILIEN